MIVRHNFFILLDVLDGPHLLPLHVSLDPAPHDIGETGVVDDSDLVVEAGLTAVAAGVWVINTTHDDAVGAEDVHELPFLSRRGQYPALQSGILAEHLLTSLRVQIFEVIYSVVELENLGLGFIINVGIVFGLELAEISPNLQCEKGMLVHDDLPLLDLSGGKLSLSLVGSLSGDEGRTGGLLLLRVHGLTLALNLFSLEIQNV